MRNCSGSPAQSRSLPSRGAWIEIQLKVTCAAGRPSLPSRGAWIEMCFGIGADAEAPVAPLAGSVD